MNTALRLLLALSVVLVVAACKSTPDVDETPDATPDTTPVDTAPALDAANFTDSRNLDNPDSLLSRRTIYFEFDESSVQPEYRDIVAAHAAYAASSSSARITLEGHADERGTREYNLGLGERRGNAVDGLMSAQGAGGSQLEVVSYGEERPVCRESNEDCWWQNRRVEIIYTAR